MIKMTEPRRKALEALSDGACAPVYKGIRRDVAQSLWDAGYITGSNGQMYLNAGYTVCIVTPKGKAALLESHIR